MLGTYLIINKYKAQLALCNDFKKHVNKTPRIKAFIAQYKAKLAEFVSRGKL